MKAITICQPYAHLIAYTREKRVENRGWPTRYRGPLAIHAGKSRDWLDIECSVSRGEFDASYDIDLADMAFGAVVGVAELVDCLPIEGIERGVYDRKYPWIRKHPHAGGPFCWVLDNVCPFLPVPCNGRQGLWDWTPPAELAEKLKQYGVAA